MKTTVQMGLDFRDEGDEWVCYLVGPELKPIKLGSISMGAVRNSQKVQQKFMLCMKLLIEEAGEQLIGVKPTFGDITQYKEGKTNA